MEVLKVLEVLDIQLEVLGGNFSFSIAGKFNNFPAEFDFSESKVLVIFFQLIFFRTSRTKHSLFLLDLLRFGPCWSNSEIHSGF